MIPTFLLPLANHLWQSTLFAAGMGLLALAFRQNRASVRYGLWLAASVKFLVPFSVLVSIGGWLEWRTAPVIAPPPVSYVMRQVVQPFALPETTPLPATEPQGSAAVDYIPALLFLVWGCGFAFVVLCWMRAWIRVRAAAQGSFPLDLDLHVGRMPVRVMCSPALLEPCAFGILRPVLLVPDGVRDRLTPDQLRAILMHELCHVRRRDNLTAFLHMLVETVFWFHPLVWWIGGRLMDERERACDEEVIRVIGEPEVYAQGILTVCKFCLGAPLACAAGVTGSNLKERIEDIMRNRMVHKLGFVRSLLLAIATIVALAGPIAIGTLHAKAGHTVSEPIAFRPAPEPMVVEEQRPPTIQTPEQTPQTPRTTPQNPTEAPEAFEVATVRPTVYAAGGERGAGGGGGGGGRRSPRPVAEPCGGGGNFQVQLDASRIAINDTTLHALILFAYGMDCKIWRGSDLLFGGPGWSKSDGYDVEAVIPAGTPAYTRDQFYAGNAPKVQKMLQTLLADRFKLVLRRETREIPAYSLLPAKGGIKLRAARPADPWPAPFISRWNEGDGTCCEAGTPTGVSGTKRPIANMISMLSMILGRPILDRTGLTGEYNYNVAFERQSMPGLPLPPPGFENRREPGAPPPETRPPSRVLEEDLGLKLEAITAPMEVLVVERAERPTEN